MIIVSKGSFDTHILRFPECVFTEHKHLDIRHKKEGIDHGKRD